MNLESRPSTPDFLGKVGLNLALGQVPSYCSHQSACGDLHAVGWGEGPWALVTVWPDKNRQMSLIGDLCKSGGL